ncbi:MULTISPECIES: endonuclease/exonuclease/phosphatase family protein [unclassified Leptolyngbya]|uniref:endonuclease/exonuclease/phosphatase family protein n=1 Tax=unclassified Leptolyngbya TaxID=2650499 RepID=UPI00168262EB|nr:MULTISPECIES: endonuclease/exonuclease/phosphatase family protein [unclassified Leptolyngbya]MBD1912928.1 endonuclease/exonuclease/phosphatase family protein [Leptolyngbya sp. FACHB-8]MBD2154743.1 endonuclease/exonuclease/phosphatase family protein [Leptolyngbya sp. FACHB-16]
MRVRIGTFNAENLFARFRFRDQVLPIAPTQPSWTSDETRYAPFSEPRHRITAEAMGAIRADILGLQEIENLPTLRLFLKQFTLWMPAEGYPYPLVIDGNDPRQIDVGIVSRFPLGAIRTHQFDRTPEGAHIFSRDCLEVEICLPHGKTLTIFVNHFKSMAENRDSTMAIRQTQAKRVVEILQERFGPDPGEAAWVVLGDLNDYLPSKGLEPLLSQPWLENVLNRLPSAERWTHYFAEHDTYNQLDYLLLSRSLAKANPTALPEIERRGMPGRATKIKEARFKGVGHRNPKASDHCPLVIEIDI